MHYHCEVIMPPTNDVEAALDEILRPFSEHDEECSRPFWDYYLIGGRWSGVKLEEKLGKVNLDNFRKELQEKKITVSSIIAGKQTLEPKSQEEEVDALWQERFPHSGLSVCPLFRHAGPTLPGDISTVAETPLEMTVARVIIAGPNYDDKGFRAATMLVDRSWNGVSFQDTTWDSSLQSAIEEHCKSISNSVPEWQDKNTVQDDWLVVTVDYHS